MDNLDETSVTRVPIGIIETRSVMKFKMCPSVWPCTRQICKIAAKQQYINYWTLFPQPYHPVKLIKQHHLLSHLQLHQQQQSNHRVFLFQQVLAQKRHPHLQPNRQFQQALNKQKGINLRVKKMTTLIHQTLTGTLMEYLVLSQGVVDLIFQKRLETILLLRMQNKVKMSLRRKTH